MCINEVDKYKDWNNFWAVYKSGTGTRGQGHRNTCVGTWDLGRRDEGLKDINYGTWGCVGRGCRDVKNWDAGDAGCEWISQKSEVNGISVTFLENMFWWRQPTLTSLAFLHACLRSEASAKTPCIEESETVVLVFLLMEYWSPKQEGWVAVAKIYVE